MTLKHLSEHQLVESHMNEAAPAVQHHLAGCLDCQSRRQALVSLLDEVGSAIEAEADAVFPAERRSRQRASILQQIDQLARPGRVISFPAGQSEAAPLVRTRTSRWIAAAAAAAFIVGVLTGQQMPRGFHLVNPAPATAPSAATAGVPARAATPASSDDQFLSEVEVAVGGTAPAMLKRIDVLTPLAWDSQ